MFEKVTREKAICDVFDVVNHLASLLMRERTNIDATPWNNGGELGFNHRATSTADPYTVWVTLTAVTATIGAEFSRGLLLLQQQSVDGVTD
jgi:hypothetical protein